jgi:NADPH:quinone reductase-like Zn-dependent oxidoreductase
MADGGTTMRAVVTAGGRLVLSEVPRPAPAPGETLVRVAVISLNRGEVKTALAAEDGWRPGWDYAGVVAEAAADGSGPPKGARVVGALPVGAWAEYVAVGAPFLAALPNAVSFEDAATLPIAGLTARRALGKGAAKPGRRVLVTGASGGVGVFGVQLAAKAGDVVTAAIRNPAHEPLMRDLGATNVLVGPSLAAADPDLRYDLILDSVAGASLGAALERLAPGGTCVNLGASENSVTTFDTAKFRVVGGTTLVGLNMNYELRFEAPSVGLADLAGRLADGSLRTVIEARAPIADIARVADDLIERRFVGKAVLTF